MLDIRKLVSPVTRGLTRALLPTPLNALDLAGDGIVLLDRAGQIADMNAEARRLINRVDADLAAKRNHVAGSMYIFGNMKGQRDKKGGWKPMLDDLMRECVKAAKEKGIEFKRFSLQDCRVMGVTDKLDRGDTDIRAATGHTSQKMINSVYDRNR